MAQRGNGEGSVYQESSTGRWVAAVTIDGKRRRSVGKTQAEAKRHLRDMLNKVDSGLPIGDGALTVGQLLDQWKDTALASSDLSPKTIETYLWAVDMLRATIGKRRLKSLAPEHVEAAFTRLATTGYGKSPTPMSRASLAKARSVLGQALEFGKRRQLVSRNIAREVYLPAQARRTEAGRSLTVEQANQLLGALKGHRLEALFVVMLMLGLRPGEASGLTWADIDLDAEVIHVRRSLKLHNRRPVVTEQLKTDRSRRSLDAPPQVIEALRRHRARQAADRLEAGPLWSNPDDLAFTNTSGTPINPSSLRRTLAKITEGADLGRWHPHELRHSAASLLSASGVPLEEVADVLGHDGTRLTALVYRHATTPTVKAARRMGDILGPDN